MNLDENKKKVWLGTSFGNLLCFSSMTLKYVQGINTYENTKVLSILFGKIHCFAIL